MKADLVVREPQRLQQWQSGNLYARIRNQRDGAPKFVLHDGPPFANGDVHIGTALNKILKDIIIKYKTLRGLDAPYIPGWDCHGLPIEFKVTQEMRKAGDTSSDAAEIRKACDAYARKYIDIQRAQFKRLGVLGEWENPYLTLNKEYEAEELRLFADLVEQDFVYRGKKPVYWSIPPRTALAEAEVEYKDHVSQSIFVKFPLEGHPGTSIVVWTTTPWTLPANLAVAYNSTFSYSLVQVGGEQLIVSALLLPAVAQKCGWETYEIVRSLNGAALKDLRYRHPFCNRTGRFHAGDSFVENTTGTGLVHVAPGHGTDDYLLGSANGLPIYSPVDDDGRLVHTTDLPVDQQMPAELLGKSILEKHGKSDANEAVLHILRTSKALLHQENYHHTYPYCWRSKTPVIFRAMDQWFIKIDHRNFRDRALDEIERVKWVPDWGKNRIEAAVRGRPDWCISRQRTWGVPIPAFYDATNRPILDARIVRNTAALVEQHGSNVWFEKTSEELWEAVKPSDWAGPTPVRKSTDTLDVWIDSGSSSRCVIAQRKELRGNEKAFQCDMYLEGSDQHRGWFQSSLLLSLAASGAAPFRTVLTHGFMVDADREKISKSKQGQGGYEKPQTSDAYVKKWGADVVRLWVSSQDFRNDIIVSEERIAKVSETYRVLRNALRYQLSNLFDFDPSKHSVPDEKLTALDRWILAEFSRIETDYAAACDTFEFHNVYQKLSQFVAVELSAIYHDVVKDRLYTHAAGSHSRRSTQTALYRICTSLCKMLSPILAFTSDEAWAFLPGQASRSVHEAAWAPSEFEQTPEERERWTAFFEFRDLALTELEKARQAKTIGKALDACLHVSGPEHPALADAEARETLREVLNVSQLEFEQQDGALVIAVRRAAGEKCERCWHYDVQVGKDTVHPTICGRCKEAVLHPAQG